MKNTEIIYLAVLKHAPQMKETVMIVNALTQYHINLMLTMMEYRINVIQRLMRQAVLMR